MSQCPLFTALITTVTLQAQMEQLLGIALSR